MIQVIAVHSGGTLPRTMELDTSGLNFVQAHAFKFLPRTPSGIPELRALGKGDGAVQFRFKVPPEKVSPGSLPDLLTQWDCKFTEATLKLVAQTNKAERDAASAAGLWKDGSDKGDLNAMRAQCSKQDAHDFNEALATVKCKVKAKGMAGNRRKAKPKELAAVVDATTDLDPFTGDVTTKLSASEKAVSQFQARQLVASFTHGAGAPCGNQDTLVDPLEESRLSDLADRGKHANALSATSLQSGVAAQPAVACAARQDIVDKALNARQQVENHKGGIKGGPRLIEMEVEDLFRQLDKVWPVALKGAAGASGFGLSAAASPEAGDKQFAGDGMSKPLHASTIAVYEGTGNEVSDGYDAEPAFDSLEAFERQASGAGFDGIEQCEAQPHAAHAGMLMVRTSAPPDALAPVGPVEEGSDAHQCFPLHTQVTQSCGPGDWSGLASFRLVTQDNPTEAVVLPSGEMFEALAQLRIANPLAVRVEWLLDSAAQDGYALPDAERLQLLTNWMKAQLAWRSRELVRWLGSADLVSAKTQNVAKPEPAKGATRRRPAGWIDEGMALAPLAQQISMDIAMLDLCARDIERVLAGMPAWAIQAMQQMREFEKAQLEGVVTADKSEPGAAFRDSWRAELERIDRWCAIFKPIRIARQIGLFGSESDAKLLGRLEALIERTKTWKVAPAQASRVLAVWLGFVLSLDHTALPDLAVLTAAGDLQAGAQQGTSGVAASPAVRKEHVHG